MAEPPADEPPVGRGSPEHAKRVQDGAVEVTA